MSNAQSSPLKTPMLNPKEAIVRCFKKYATFKGRATRAEYWWFILFNSLVCSVAYAAVQFLMGTETADTAMSLVQLALFLPALAVSVRRLHDINFNGWWMLLWITVIGVIPLIVFFCLPGKAEENRFGAREAGAQPDTNRQRGGSTNTAGMFLGIIAFAGMSFAAPLFTAQTSLCEEHAPAADSADTQTAPSSSPSAPQTPADASSDTSGKTSGDTSITISNQELEQGLQEVFGSLFTVMEGTIGGMTKGMQEGARDMQTRLDGADGTRLITNAKELTELTETGVLKAEQLEDGSWKITLSVKNTQEFPVRLTGLTDKQQVLLLDQENYAYEQKGGERIVTVPERAAQKIALVFPELDGSAPKTLRIYGMDFPVPQPTKIL